MGNSAIVGVVVGAAILIMLIALVVVAKRRDAAKKLDSNDVEEMWEDSSSLSSFSPSTSSAPNYDSLSAEHMDDATEGPSVTKMDSFSSHSAPDYNSLVGGSQADYDVASTFTRSVGPDPTYETASAGSAIQQVPDYQYASEVSSLASIFKAVEQ